MSAGSRRLEEGQRPGACASDGGPPEPAEVACGLAGVGLQGQEGS